MDDDDGCCGLLLLPIIVMIVVVSCIALWKLAHWLITGNWTLQ